MKKIILTLIALFALVGIIMAACPASKDTVQSSLMSKFVHKTTIKHTNATKITMTPHHKTTNVTIPITIEVTKTKTTPKTTEPLNIGKFEKEILDTHNKYRSEVGVPNLAYSGDLAAGAKEWANYLAANKLFEHSPKPRTYGENIHWNTAGSKTYPQMMDGWYNEKTYFKNGVYPNCTTDSTKVIGHYTQLIWRNTKQVGCGVGTGNGRDVLVCRYSPPGNYIGQKVY